MKRPYFVSPRSSLLAATRSLRSGARERPALALRSEDSASRLTKWAVWAALLPRPLSELVKGRQGGAVAGLLDQLAHQLDRLELRVDDVQAGRVPQEVEHRAVVDHPGQRPPDRLQEPLQL